MSDTIIIATNNIAKIDDFAHSAEAYHLNLITMKDMAYIQILKRLAPPIMKMPLSRLVRYMKSQVKL